MKDFFEGLGSSLIVSLDTIVFTVVIFFLATVILRIISAYTKKQIEKHRNDKDLTTAMTLFRSGARYILYFFATILCIGHIGFGEKVSSAFVAAGVGGLILTLGTQSLVKDILSGLIIAFEKPYLVGDYVKIGEHEGVVFAIALKSTYLDYFGKKIVIPNGNVSNVINYSGKVLSTYVTLTVPVKTPLKTAEKALEKALKNVYSEYKTHLAKLPTYEGIEGSAAMSYDLSVSFETCDLSFIDIERAIKTEFRKEIDKAICQ